MNKFGVCRCDLDSAAPTIENLKIFETYEQAYNYYLKVVSATKSYPYGFSDKIWITLIEEDRIIQFERLSYIVKSKIVKINKQNNE